MTNTALNSRNIFTLSLSDFTSREDLKLIYAPLAGVCALAMDDEINALAQNVADYPFCDNKDLIETFVSGSAEQAKANAVDTADDFLQLYILPNFKCNFSCSYCFSANGRATEEVKEGDLLATLDFFINRDRINTDALSISYLGGGEPTLSWEIVKSGLEYAAKLAEKYDIKLYTTIVTNGSKLTDEIASILKKYNVLVRVSFEVLPEIQALQRGQYDSVCKGLKILEAHDVNHMIRSMITPDNVGLLECMVEEIHRKFTKVRSVLFDPITSSQTFSEPMFTAGFYDKYFRHFLAARGLGKKYDIDVANATLRNLNLIVERYCAGELCLTPLGTVTICHQVSSPREEGYSDFIFGKVEGGRLCIDYDKFQRLKSRYTIYDNPRCTNCPVKWTCGGGCTQRRRQYNEDILDVICASERRLTTAFLLERLAGDIDVAEYINRYGLSDI